MFKILTEFPSENSLFYLLTVWTKIGVIYSGSFIILFSCIANKNTEVHLLLCTLRKILINLLCKCELESFQIPRYFCSFRRDLNSKLRFQFSGFFDYYTSGKLQFCELIWTVNLFCYHNKAGLVYTTKQLL